MKDLLLQEIRQYLQIHLNEAFTDSKMDETCCFQIKEEDAFPQLYRAIPSMQERAAKEPPKELLHDSNLQKAAPKENHNKVRNLFQVAHASRPETDIEDYIQKTKNAETFSTKLLKYIDATGLPDALIYKRAGIDRRHFSKIRCDRQYRPKKATAVALCLALELQMEQAAELLELAGYSLSNSDTGDLIVKFCIEKGIFNLMEVNDALIYFGEKALGVVV